MDWNPIGGASAYSAFAAVLAGFVFACIVVVGTDRGHSDPRSRSNTLVLFISSFFCLVASSYLGALTSSEVVCLRAWTVTVYISSLLAIGGTAVFTGIAWLLNGYIGNAGHDTEARAVARFAKLCAYCVAIVVVPLITMTVQGYMFDMDSTTQIPAWLEFSPLVYLCVMPVLILLMLTKRIGHRIGSRVPLTHVGTAIVATSLLTLIAMAIPSSMHADRWVSSLDSVLVTTTLFPLVVSAVMLMLLLATLPHLNRDTVARSDESTAPNQSD